MRCIGTLLIIGGVLAGCGGPTEPTDPSPPDVARGVLGGYERGHVWGWAQVTGDSEPVRVRIEVDGEPVAVAVADEPRDDLVRKGMHATGRAGFSAEIGPLSAGAEVDAIIEGYEQPLTNGACLVQGDFGVTSCTEGLSRGVLGGYEDGRVWGWAHVIGRGEPIEVRIEVDGDPVATVLADRPRTDLLAKRLHPSGRAGFEVEIGDVAPHAEIAAFVDEDDHRLRAGRRMRVAPRRVIAD